MEKKLVEANNKISQLEKANAHSKKKLKDAENLQIEKTTLEKEKNEE